MLFLEQLLSLTSHKEAVEEQAFAEGLAVVFELVFEL